jgi:hypothetical protein
MKIVRGPARPAPPSRPIKSFDRPAEGPHRHPPQHPPIRGSNKIAADAVRKASDHSGAIDVRKRYDDPGNLN